MIAPLLASAAESAGGVDVRRVLLEVTATDRAGLLARSAAALADAGLDVAEAGAAVWGSAAVQTFLVRSGDPPDPEGLQRRLTEAPARRPPPVVAAGATVSWDDESSPWTTVCTIEAPDRIGLLAALSAAFELAGARLQSARVCTEPDGTVRDVFEVTNRRGDKLSDAEKERVVAALGGEAPARSRLGIRLARSDVLRGRKPAAVPGPTLGR